MICLSGGEKSIGVAPSVGFAPLARRAFLLSGCNMKGCYMSTSFRDSQNFSARRAIRQFIKKSDLTKNEQAILAKIVNLWFRHAGLPKWVIHPGRKLLAKDARCSIITVARALALFRERGFIEVVRRPRGEGQRPTEYAVNLTQIIVSLSGDRSIPVDFDLFEYVSKRYKNETPNDTPLAYQNDTQSKDDRLDQRRTYSNVVKMFGNGDHS